MIKENTILSTHWEYGVLSDAVDKGSSNISLNKVKNDEGRYPLFSAKGHNKNISFFHQEKEYLAIIKDGAGIGRVSKHPAKSSVVATMQYLIPKEGFDIGFVRYFLNGIDFEKYRQGSTIPHVYFKDYKSEPFPLLPLPQQKQIVSILDKAFAAIDRAKANAEQNLQNAKELFESYLQNVFENKGDDWEMKRMFELFDVKSSKRVHKADWKKDGIPFYRAREVVKLAQNGTVNNDLFISEELYEEFTKDKGAPKEGDIIISAVGTLGQCYLVKSSDKFYFKDASVLWFENISNVDTRYIEYAFKSDSIMKQVMNKSMGATVGTLTISRAKIIIIPTPPLPQQKQIVKKLDSLSAETKKLESIYIQKLADLEEMKKSILQKAFSGQLSTIN